MGVGLAQAHGFFQGRDCDICSNAAAVCRKTSAMVFAAPKIGIDDAFDVMHLNIGAEELVGKPHDVQRRIVDRGLRCFRADGDPHPSRHLVSDAVEGERRE